VVGFEVVEDDGGDFVVAGDRFEAAKKVSAKIPP
jgi:hypothetical protein